jgi:hypothetical protein
MIDIPEMSVLLFVVPFLSVSQLCSGMALSLEVNMIMDWNCRSGK